MTGNPPQMTLDLGSELIIDLFAGGGGTSTGLERAFKRPVDVAVNHDPCAISMHKANHPRTRHFCESVFKVDPHKATNNRPVGLLWASPDCTHHSRAKGGKPVKKHIRGLAWVIVKWARRTRPRSIMAENVEEFIQWGPLNKDNRPCKAREGQEFKKFVFQLERLGYKVEHRVLAGCDYGAPTIRRRLFLVARCDGRPIEWPEPTHAAPDDPRVVQGALPAHRTAAECIDFSVPARSIFGRKKPLAVNTLNRIAKGVDRFVINNDSPFILEQAPGQACAHAIVRGDYQSTGQSTHDLCAPPHHDGDHASRAHERSGQIGLDADTDNAELVGAFMEQANTGAIGRKLDAPLATILGKGSQQRLVYCHLINQKGSDQRSRSLNEPAPTICAGGTHAGLVSAILAPYYGSGSGKTGRDVRQPVPTITSKDRLQLVLVKIGSDNFAIIDIAMRMLQPRELYRAQGFPDTYIIEHGHDGAPLPKYVQTRLVGNSVCPDISYALARANFAHEPAIQADAA